MICKMHDGYLVCFFFGGGGGGGAWNGFLQISRQSFSRIIAILSITFYQNKHAFYEVFEVEVSFVLQGCFAISPNKLYYLCVTCTTSALFSFIENAL